MEASITATRSQIAAAFDEWDREAKENAWPDRTDGERNGDAADYLMMLLRKHGAV